MNTAKRIGTLALVLALPPAHAALWSVDNEVVRAGDKATLTLSVAGDGLTHGASVDITIPHGFQVAAARPLNGAQCNLMPNPNPTVVADIVRAVHVSPWGAIATRRTPVCEFTVVATTSFSDWFRLTSDQCNDGTAQRVPCVLDPGFVVVVP